MMNIAQAVMGCLPLCCQLYPVACFWRSPKHTGPSDCGQGHGMTIRPCLIDLSILVIQCTTFKRSAFYKSDIIRAAFLVVHAHISACVGMPHGFPLVINRSNVAKYLGWNAQYVLLRILRYLLMDLASFGNFNVEHTCRNSVKKRHDKIMFHDTTWLHLFAHAGCKSRTLSAEPRTIWSSANSAKCHTFGY